MYKLSDGIVQSIINNEFNRQNDELEMIASENYVSKEVIMAYANVFTNKYSEGYPGKRYYGGQVNVDELEILTQYRALKVFGLIDCGLELVENREFTELFGKIKKNERGVNVQPLSGSPANLAVYLGVLEKGDTILGMSLDTGGHLSHGHSLNSSGRYYNIVSYGVDKETFLIDYDDILEKALESKPKLILAGFSAYPRDIDWKKFSEIADTVEEKLGYRPLLMADIAHIAGLIAGKSLESPFPFFDIVTTTTHKTLRGPRGAVIFYRNGKFKRNGVEISLKKLIDRGVFPGIQGGPHDHVCVAKCIAFGEILRTNYHDYTEKVIKNARKLAETLVSDGWELVTGGTDNHIVLLDVTINNGKETGITGKDAEKILENIGLSVNKNMLPYDKRGALDPSGLRIGTPAITTRGLGYDEMVLIGNSITKALLSGGDDSVIASCKEQISSICKNFPLDY